MIMDKFKSRKGFTLIEVLLTVTIMSIVLLVFASFFSPRLSLYLIASDEADIHSELNILNRKIHDELINITEEQLLSSVPGSFQTGYEYYYLNGNNNLVKVDSSGNSNIINPSLEFNNFEISLHKRSGDEQNYVTVTMDAILDNADHEMQFNILLNNIKEEAASDQNVDYIGIKYR